MWYQIDLQCSGGLSMDMWIQKKRQKETEKATSNEMLSVTPEALQKARKWVMIVWQDISGILFETSPVQVVWLDISAGCRLQSTFFSPLSWLKEIKQKYEMIKAHFKVA